MGLHDIAERNERRRETREYLPHTLHFAVEYDAEGSEEHGTYERWPRLLVASEEPRGRQLEIANLAATSTDEITAEAVATLCNDNPEDDIATLLGALERMQAALDRRRVTTADVCRCENCQAAVARLVDYACKLCGYQGAPLPLGCACYDGQCSGGARAGSGCPHGSMACPVCDDGDGDIDPWAIIRELRGIVRTDTGGECTRL